MISEAEKFKWMILETCIHMNEFSSTQSRYSARAVSARCTRMHSDDTLLSVSELT